MIRRFLFSTTHETSNLNEIAVTVLRVFVGLSMALAHGMGKIPVNDQFVDGVRQLGLPFPVVMAWAAAFSEFVGGLLLAAGLCTRLGALSIAMTMAVAAFVVHAADPYQNKEMAFLYFVIALFFVVRGGSRYSLDALAKRA